MIFYHASNVANLKEILPLSNDKQSGEKAAYFTPLRAYSLFYLRDMEVNNVAAGMESENKIISREFFQDQLRITYQRRSGYIYACEDSGNITLARTTGIWTAKKPIAVTSSEYIGDVYEHIMREIAAGIVHVVSYESLSEEQKQEITERMKNFILERNFLNTDSAQSRFWAKYYPQAWKMAEDVFKIILLRDDYVGETVDLYRVVGVRERESIFANKAFLPGMNSLEGRQFVFTEQEVINYAITDASKIAVAKAVITKDILNKFDFSDNIDSKIFINGVITVQPEENELFNESIIRIEIKERLSD